MPLFAVHLSDGPVQSLWCVIGFALAALPILPAVIRVSDDEIPRIGLLTAAFFVASLIHVKLGVTSVHLLLNGLVGVILGRRAPLAIAVALLLQAWLLGHGGYSTLGLNTVIMALPALASRTIFVSIVRNRRPSPRKAFIAGAICGGFAVLLTAFLYAGVLLVAGIEDLHVIATLGFAVHIPLAAIEALIVGTASSYLAKVKPEMLGICPVSPEKAY